MYQAFATIVDPGDEVLLPAPYWTTYPEAVALAGGVAVEVIADETQNYLVTVEQLEAARTPRTKVLLFCSPSNPTGSVYSEEQVKAIGEWAVAHGIWVIADEIYEHLLYDGATAPSMPVVVPDLAERCIILNGVAKTYAMTGWRVGWMIGPKDVIKAATNLQSHLSSNVNNVAQRAAIAALNGDLTAVEEMKRAFDRRRKLMVRANADTETDASNARRFGAQGIGLCRTEHMFLGDRRVLIERVILAKDTASREEALAALLPLQKSDFTKILEGMDGFTTTIRLLDPPLHEFLPDLGDLKVKSALAHEHGKVNTEDEELLQAVEKMHESNPMLGLRGVRLGLVSPGLYDMQVRAIAEAMASLISMGKNPKVEIMIPLVGSHMELQIARKSAEKVIKLIEHEQKIDLPIEIGTMIELPRAALTANRIAGVADFFSFGTNDLTQTTWGYSRDDVEAEFFSKYFELGVFTISPFETIDQFGVGELVEIAVERGLSVNPKLHLGVCGEHGGDPESIHFFHKVGLDYVSCSPFRVPIARLEAGRAAVS